MTTKMTYKTQGALIESQTQV